MADTPSIPLPLDPKEQPILDSLLAIRTELTLLKQDRSSYVKSSDVIPLYEKTVAQVTLLNEIRAQHPEEENRGKWGRSSAFVWTLLSDILQLIEF